MRCTVAKLADAASCHNPRLTVAPELESGEAEKVDWLQPVTEEGLRSYAETLRERARLVIAIFLVTTLVAVLYVLTAAKSYEARADLLVTPIGGEIGVLRSLPLIFETADPTRDVETASLFVANLDTARSVDEDLDIPDSTPRDLLNKVEVAPVAQSNIVAITATGDSPKQAQEIANAFAEATIDDRTDQVQEAAEQLLAAVEANLESPSPDIRAQAAADAAQLGTIINSPDPSIRIETLADEPTGQTSPRPALTIFAGMLSGAILGIVGAFVAQAVDPRLRREEQLRRRFRLPIIARVPLERRTTRSPLGPSRISPAGAEAYRTLRATLEAGRREGESRALLVTGTAPSEGKSTTAVNLAASLALAGRSVTLIEADLRRPALADALDMKPKNGGVVSVLLKDVSLKQALVQTGAYGPGMNVLLADHSEGWIAELFSTPAAQELIEEAKTLADYVIIDSPPLNLVADAVPLARTSDEVLIVVRLGQTTIRRITELGELLAENGVRPVGFTVVGVQRPQRRESRYYLDEKPGAK